MICGKINFCCGGSVRIICGKRPEYSMLAAAEPDKLSFGERLRVMRLCAGLKIDEAAKAVGIGRRTVMNYELGRVEIMKQGTVEKLMALYSGRKF